MNEWPQIKVFWLWFWSWRWKYQFIACGHINFKKSLNANVWAQAKGGNFQENLKSVQTALSCPGSWRGGGHLLIKCRGVPLENCFQFPPTKFLKWHLDNPFPASLNKFDFSRHWWNTSIEKCLFPFKAVPRAAIFSPPFSVPEGKKKSDSQALYVIKSPGHLETDSRELLSPSMYLWDVGESVFVPSVDAPVPGQCCPGWGSKAGGWALWLPALCSRAPKRPFVGRGSSNRGLSLLLSSSFRYQVRASQVKWRGSGWDGLPLFQDGSLELNARNSFLCCRHSARLLSCTLLSFLVKQTTTV